MVAQKPICNKPERPFKPGKPELNPQKVYGCSGFSTTCNIGEGDIFDRGWSLARGPLPGQGGSRRESVSCRVGYSERMRSLGGGRRLGFPRFVEECSGKIWLQSNTRGQAAPTEGCCMQVSNSCHLILSTSPIESRGCIYSAASVPGKPKRFG
jgi:hypothetical protein